MAQKKPKDPVQILAQFEKSAFIKDFYLAGGTGLNIQLGHRASIDLDFFTRKKVTPDILLSRLSKKMKIEALELDTGTLKILLDKIPVSFFQYDYPLLDFSIHKGIKVASLMDIALMKIIAILQRGEKKDFIDLYCIITQAEIPLQVILENLEKKFKGVEFNTGSIYKALVFFDDAERSGPLYQTRVKWKTVKKYFKDIVKNSL